VAIAVIGGLIISTMLSLVFVPAVFTALLACRRPLCADRIRSRQ
jgi:Cu/Ag efflux pump CusA